MQTTDIVSFIQEKLKESNRKISLSVLVLSGKEGIIAHKTMLSIIEAIKECLDKNYYCEILVGLNNSDDTTMQYFQRYKKLNGIRVFETNYQSIGDVKNFLIEKTKGRYVAFIYSGNIISSNYLSAAIQMLNKEKNPSIAHTEAILEFGAQQSCTLTIHQSSTTPIATIDRLLSDNHWSREFVSTKNTIKKYPYLPNSPSYIDDDYSYDLLSIQHGVKHIVVPKTVLFKRKSATLQTQSSNYIPYMELLNPLNYKNHIPKNNIIEPIDKKEKESSTQENPQDIKDKTAAEEYSAITTLAQKNKGLFHSITSIFNRMCKNNHRQLRPSAKSLRQIKPPKPQKLEEQFRTTEPINDTTANPPDTEIPNYVETAWEKANSIETQLYPHPWIIKDTLLQTKADNAILANTYHKLANSITKQPDYIFIIPWLIRGGGDKAILNYAHALSQIHPKWHFAFIATEPKTNSTWAEKIPPSSDFIEFGKICQDVNHCDRDKLMTLLISQLNCKKIHIVNSELGYIWAKNHQSLIKNEYQLYVSIFAAEFFPGTNCKCTFSYEDPYLSDIIAITDKVFTDNQTMIKRMIEREGFINTKQFKAHYQPVSFLKVHSPKTSFVEPGKLHILWAGRIVPVKLPEIITSIAKRLDHDKYIFDVYGEANDVDIEFFNDVKNIHYHGSFDGFASIPTNEADLFLYTSMSDGIPNTILEASAAGLPIIATNDGGVGEFIINKKTGLLIDDIFNPDAYARTIISLKDIKPLASYVKNAQKLLQDRHSWSTFVKNVKQDINS